MNHAAPASLVNSRNNKYLQVQWSHNDICIFSHQRLRGACPCAKCRAARIHGHISLVNDNVEIVEINSMGYGIQLVFSDGHDRGIYPWGYLKELEILAAR